jgi:hypothetical protein
LNIEARFRDAVQHYWTARRKQQQKQIKGGKIDAGTRGAVTGGTQMGALEVLVADILLEAGLEQLDIKTRTALELPGYYRPEKKWDLIVVSKNQLVCAGEFKSQVGPSFGNNFNNRTEEAIGSATDIWRAYREGRFGSSPEPFLGYFFLLEDCPAVKTPVRNFEPYFEVDPEFKGVSYSKRYEVLFRRLVLDRLYRGACLTLATNELETKITHPAEDLNFQRFAAALRGHVVTFLGSQNSHS